MNLPHRSVHVSYIPYISYILQIQIAKYELLPATTASLNDVCGPIYHPNPERNARDKGMANIKQARLSKIYNLAAQVESDRSLSRRAQVDWVKLDASDINCSQLDKEYLETVACDRYQISLAPGYIVETVGNR